VTARNRWVRFALPVGVLAIVVALTLLLLYHAPVRRSILDPVTWMINDVRRALAPLPQALLWAIGLLIGCAVLLASWRRLPSETEPKRARWTAVRPHNTNAIAGLARDLERSPRHHVSRVRIVRELSVLAVRLIARREGLPLEEARRLLISGQWPDDPLVQEFFATRPGGGPGVPKQRFLEAVAHTLAHLERYHQEV
jgi:hypothetical protein